jgi:hypothetical protein
MSTMKSLLKWVELAAVVSAVIGITYLFGLPILLPRLWPEIRLPLALLAGSVVLILALMPDISRRHPAGEGPTGRPASRVEPTVERRLRTPGFEPNLSSTRFSHIEQTPHIAQRSVPVSGQPSVEATAKPPAATTSVSTTEAEHHYEELLRRKTHGDTALMGRLVEYERVRNPRATRSELLAAAVERWEHDNR